MLNLKFEIAGIEISDLLYLERFFHLDRSGQTPLVDEMLDKTVRRKKAPTPTIQMTRSTYIGIMKSLLSQPPEQACVLLGPMNSQLVTDFAMDEGGRSSPVRFELDDLYLNGVLREYLGVRMEAKGFCHSHPAGCTQLSGGDLEYLRRTWANPKNDCQQILMPIVAGRKMHPYIVERAAPTSPKLATLQLI